MARLHAVLASSIALTALGSTTGCIYKMTGGVMSDYTVEHLGPHMLEQDDLGMACETGVSMGTFLMSFARVTDDVDVPAILTLLSAGTCAEEIAWQEELRGIRAVHAKNASEALDARTAQKRAHATAAARFYGAFQKTEAAFGALGGPECPDLDEEADQLAYLLGLVAAAQSLVHDRAAAGTVGVPLDAPRRAARASRCLDDNTWWGVPMALRAGVWLSIPGSTPEGEDPFKRIEEAAALADKAGVRIARAVGMQAMVSAGRGDLLPAALESFVQAGKTMTAATRWKLLDALAERQTLALSDRLWTEQTGHRTPFQELGTLPETPSEDSDEDDDLLGDIDSEDS